MAQNTKLISSGGSDQTMDSTLAPSSDGRGRFSDRKSAPVRSMPMVGTSESTRQLPYCPSSASLNSSWSSSGSSDSEGDSYAWSASLSSGSNSDSDYDSSDYSSFSGASSGDEESDDNRPGQAQPQGKSLPKPILMPPPGPPPPPMEGLDLSAIAHLKSELMKVGQAIIQSNVGQERAERAQTLASINWLSSHVPNAVLDHLGHEIRQMIEEEKGGVKDDGSTNEDKLATSVGNSDAMTDVSDLSEAYLDEMEYEHEEGADLDAEVANMTATGYGDLANFAHAKASAFLPDMDTEPDETDAPQSSAFSSIDEMTGVDTNGFVNRIPEAQPISIHTMSLDDILQQRSEDPLVPITNALGKPQSRRAENPLGHNSPSFGRPKRKEDPLGPSSHKMQSLNRSKKGSDDPLGNSTMHTSRSEHPSGEKRRGSNEGRTKRRGSMLGGPLAGPQDSNERRPSFGRPKRKEDPLGPSSHVMQSLNRSQKGSDDPLGNNTTHTSRSGQPSGEKRRGSNEGRTKRRGSMLGGPLAGPQDSNERRTPSSTRSPGHSSPPHKLDSLGPIHRTQSLNPSQPSIGLPKRKYDPLGPVHRTQSMNSAQKGHNTRTSTRALTGRGSNEGRAERRGSNEGRAERRGSSMLGGPLAGPQDSNERPPPSITGSGSGELHESIEHERLPKARGVKGLFKRFVLRSKSDTAAVRPTANTISVKKKSSVALQANPSLDFTRMPTASYDMTKPEAILPEVEMNPESRKNPGDGNNPAESDLSQSFGGSSSDSSSDESEENPLVSNGSKDQDGTSKDKLKGANLPQSELYFCSLLFVDISGFTKLSTLLDPESLSRAINSYFQLIVDEVMEGKGDLLKFAGDAVFVEWKATATNNLESCVEQASSCAAKIITRCSDFSVFSNGSSGGASCITSSLAVKVESLNVHCGIGAGHMVGVHVGDHKLRREYLLLGQPIQQATVATDFAKLGELALSPEAIALLGRVCDLDKDLMKIDGKNPTIAATRGQQMFTLKQRMGVHQPKIVNELSRGVTRQVEGLEVEALRKYRTKMSLYVHPVVVDNDVAAQDNFKATRQKRTAQERHREEAEIRNVYVMFINPIIETRISKNEKTNRQMYKQLNDIMNLSSRELERFSGHLRQFIVDDKGLVLIITFGLRGTTIPNMVAARALPATIAIHNAIQMELGVNCKIGATIGEAYCGVVGGVKRHEYAVLGPSVNLAARLMSSKTNPGILVDNRVRMMANRSYAFNALPPVKAKGYAEPVPIFEPLSPLERMWGRILPNFVGRKNEIMKVMEMARDIMLAKESPSKLVIIEGESGMGKTTMVAHCIEHIRKLMGANKHRLIVTKNISKQSDSLVPFGAFRAILLDVLDKFRASNDDKSYISGASCYSSLQHTIAWESLSGRSIAQSTCNFTTSKSSQVLRNICRELDMSPSFIEHALHDLLGVERPNKDGIRTRVKPPSAKLMVSFMARAFKICTQGAKLVVVALDDLQYADDLSWKVIREIFDSAPNILIVGTSYPTKTCKLQVEAKFWDTLQQKHKESRYIKRELGCLDKEEITSMIMKTLGLQRKEVKDELLEGVTIQSGGLPHFVNEILEHMKGRMALDPDFEISDMTYESFGDLVLQRLDSFDLTTRNMLNIGAVVGLSFSLDELVGVQMRTGDGQQNMVRSLTLEALVVAVDQGILVTRTIEGEQGSGGKEGVQYSFYHAVWRTALLGLMLQGRKNDLHRAIAEVLAQEEKGVEDYMFQTKLFTHWICANDFAKAAQLALTVGRHFEERLGLPAKSIRLYNEALNLLRESSDISIGVGGFTAKVLDAVDNSALSFIIRLQVALGDSLAMAHQMTESVTSHQDVLRIVQTAKSSAELQDRSILFPVFTGLSLALKRGHIVQDAECKYEQAMLRRYVQETRIFGKAIHIIHAITLQADMYSRLGAFDLALQAHKQIEPIYVAEEHSLDLCDEYGSDLGAQSFASSALWNLQLENTEDALGTCWFVIEELMPKIEKRNVHASFMIMYPILWVMKENGFALEAREYFEEFVCEAYTEYYGEGRSTFFLPLYDPVMMLLDLSGNACTDEIIIEEYLEWAMDIDNLGFGTLINSKSGELGRTADSIAAEICFLLAHHIDGEEDRQTLIENGIEVATEDLDFAKEKGMILAEYCAANMLANLEDFLAEMKEDND